MRLEPSSILTSIAGNAPSLLICSISGIFTVMFFSAKPKKEKNLQYLVSFLVFAINSLRKGEMVALLF